MIGKVESTIFNSLLLFYVAMATNFLLPLYPKRHIEFLQKTPIIKYLLGFIFMIFSIYHLSDIKSPSYVLTIAVFLYIWFLITTILPVYYNTIFLILLTIAFLFNMKTEEVSEDIYEKNKYQTYVTFIFTYIVVLTLLGYIYISLRK